MSEKERRELQNALASTCIEGFEVTEQTALTSNAIKPSIIFSSLTYTIRLGRFVL